MSLVPIALKNIYVPIRILLENYLVNFNNNNDISQITDNIYVGNLSTGTNKELLKELGITHVVSALSHFYPPHPDDFQYLHVYAYDVIDFDISKDFENSNQFIDDAIKNGGKVYIHCMCGVSRSVTLTIAYLMTKKPKTIEDFIRFVQSKRGVANPNPGFVGQLRKFQKEKGYLLMGIPML